MNQPRLISHVYNLANGPAPTGTEAERRNHAARAELWHRLGLVVIDPADLTDGWLAQAVTNEAERRYGRRAVRVGNG